MSLQQSSLAEIWWRMQEAIMWLHVAVAKATKFDMGPPTEQAAETLDNLVVFKKPCQGIIKAIAYRTQLPRI